MRTTIGGIVIALSIALSLRAVVAQPAAPDAGSGSGSGSGSGPVGEKANQDENLQNGSDLERPWAKGVSKDRQETAFRLFGEANRNLNTGLFAAALAKYKDALQSWEHPAIYFNMALAQMNLDQPLEVEKSLTRAIAYGAAPLEKDKYEHAKEYLVLNAKQLAWIEVSCKKIGANVLIDGVKAFTVEEGKPNKIELRVRTGKHTIVAERTGYNAQVDAPFIEAGQKFRIELQLYTSDELTRYKRRWDKRWVPFAVIGAGAMVGLTGALLENSAKGSYQDYDTAIAKCNDTSGGKGCVVDSTTDNLRASGNTKKTLGYVGYGVAGAAVITGAVLLYMNRQVSYEITADEYRREVSKPKPVAVTPMIAPGMAGAMVLGSF